MALAIYTLIALLTIQNIFCAPNSADVLKETSDYENAEAMLNDGRYSIFDESENHHSKMQGQRQKRYYPNFPYPYPPPPTFYGQPYTSADVISSLAEILSSLKELTKMATTPPPPPSPKVYPIIVPIYVPQVQCDCPASNEQTSKTPDTPATTEPTLTSYIPNLFDRFPEMEDERQNWGVLINNTTVDNDEDDGSRPISLGKVVPSDVAGPSVEHGSVQADINNASVLPIVAAVQPEVGTPINSRERLCDTAVVSCCLGPEKSESYKCIQSRGCRDRSLGNDPCKPQNLLISIARLQKYYNRNLH